MPIIYRKSFILVCSAILLAMAVVTQSQTVSKRVQPELANADLMQFSVGPSLVINGGGDLQQSPLPEINVSISVLYDLKKRMEARVAKDKNDYEAYFIKGLVNFQLGKSQLAINEMTELSKRESKFHLAHLLRADILASRTKVMSDIGSLGFNLDQKTLNNQLSALRNEARMRIQASLKPVSQDKVPLQLLNLSPTIKTALLVDKSSHRLYIFKRENSNSPARLVDDFYISTGRKTGNKVTEGDLKTPEGVYFITSWIPDGELPEKYGVGAFPTNYPNALDRKFGKTGDGIWLHGTDRIYYSRPPLDSEGCVVLSNPDLKKIQHLISPGKTPIVIAEQIQWVSVSEWYKKRAEVLKSIERWRLDWESLDVEKYLGHYGKEFWSGRHNQRSWKQYKTRIAKQKTYQKITLSDLSLYYYPEQLDGVGRADTMVLARFTQKYQSNNYNGEVRKRLYLIQEVEAAEKIKNSASWKILYEGR